MWHLERKRKGDEKGLGWWRWNFLTIFLYVSKILNSQLSGFNPKHKFNETRPLSDNKKNCKFSWKQRGWRKKLQIEISGFLSIFSYNLGTSFFVISLLIFLINFWLKNKIFLLLYLILKLMSITRIFLKTGYLHNHLHEQNEMKCTVINDLFVIILI